MNPSTGLDLDPHLVIKMAELLAGKYQASTPQEDAQLRELAFWRWVAYEGYAGKSPTEFLQHQRKFMTDCLSRTGWPADKFSNNSIFELGCGPLGMIEFVAGNDRHAFDPLNSFYGRLFNNLRSPDICYSDSEEQVRSMRPVDFGICFNVLDHTENFGSWFDLFFEKIKPGGHFLVQVNTVKDGFDRTEEHKKMHPSPVTYEQVSERLKKVSSGFCEEYHTTPSADNEFFFMAWGTRSIEAHGVAA